MIEWVASTTGMVFVGAFACVAVGVLGIGLRGRMVPRRARCARCHHDLHDPMPQRCGECGAALERAVTVDRSRIEGSGRDGVDWGRPVPRGGVCVVGTLLTLMAAGGVGVVGMARNHAATFAYTPDASAALAPDMLRDRLRAAPIDDAIWSSAWRAAESGAFDAARHRAAFDAAVERLVAMQTADRGFRSSAASGIVASALFGPSITTTAESSVDSLYDDDRQEMLAALVPDLDVALPSIVQGGSTLPVVPRAVLEAASGFISQMSIDLEVRRVALDGVELPRTSPAPPRRAGTTRRAEPAEFAIPAVEASRMAELEIDVALIASPAALGFLQPRAAGTPPALPTPPPSPIERMLPTIVRRIELVDANEPFPRPIVDATVGERVRDAIGVAHLAIALDMDDVTPFVAATITITPISGVAVSHDVTLHLDTMPPLRLALGTIGAESSEREAVRMHASRGWRSMPRHLLLSVWVPEAAVPLPPEIRRARLVLTPRPGPFLTLFGADQWFAEELVLDDLPLARFDLDGMEAGR